MKKILLFILISIGIFFLSFKVSAAQYGSVAATVDTPNSVLNVRSGPSTNYKIKTQLSDDSYITLISTHNDFYYIEYKENMFGYVHKDYVKLISTNAKKVNTGGANLNVRSGPSTNHRIIDQVKHKDYVIVLDAGISFSKVLFEGNKIGYVSNLYLENNFTYQNIILDVIDYKQYDNRWANVKIGDYGQTMKQIGCLTTSMAMSESYRTSTTINPLSMKNKSKYTKDGSMYWPNTYKTTSPSNYLNEIYNLLKSGKPVLIGLKNNTGGQHWVIITGYKGGNTLTKSNFIINDPGSANRHTLNDVMMVYPLFYKIAYYI